MKFHAFVGHFDEEKDIGNKFEIDLKIKTDCKKAAETDKLRYALDYQKVYTLVKKEMQKKCNLIENVAQRILNSVKNSFQNISVIEIKVTKISPKLGGLVDEVSVIFEWKKE